MTPLRSTQRTFARPPHRIRWGTCTRVAVRVTVLLAAAPAAVFGAGFQLGAQNASGLGSVFAGQAAVADDASVVWFNPAGLAWLPEAPQFAMAAQYVTSRSAFSDTGSCTPYLGAGAGTSTCPFGRSGNLGHAAGGEGDHAPATAAFPNLYAAAPLLAGKVWVGLGINVPFGLKNDYGDAWVGRFRTIRSETTAINVNPSIASKLGPVAFGIGFDAQRFDAKLSNAVSYSAIAFGSGVPELIAAVGPASEGVSQLKGNDWGYGWNAGLSVAARDDLRVALTYRSAIRHTLKGNISFADRPVALATAPQLADGAAEASVRLPSQFTVAAEWKPVQPVTLLVDWSRMKWSAIQVLNVVRTDGPLDGSIATSTPLLLKDSRHLAFGAVWRPDDRFSIRAGIARESSAVDERYRTPLLPDSDSILYGVGGRIALSATSSLDVGALWVKPRRPGVSLANQPSATALPQGSLNGTVVTSAVVVGGQWTSRF